MTELALNILDIVQNSIRASASEIQIMISESVLSDKIGITVKDNGKGIPANLVNKVDDPFITSRVTRKTGLGLPLLKHHAQLAGGGIEIKSQEGAGTEVRAWFGYSNIDRQPIGDIAGVMMILISANPEIDFLYTHTTDNGIYSFSTAEARSVLEVKNLSGSLLKDIKLMIQENIRSIGVSE